MSVVKVELKKSHCFVTSSIHMKARRPLSSGSCAREFPLVLMCSILCHMWAEKTRLLDTYTVMFLFTLEGPFTNYEFDF